MPRSPFELTFGEEGIWAFARGSNVGCIVLRAAGAGRHGLIVLRLFQMKFLSLPYFEVAVGCGCILPGAIRLGAPPPLHGLWGTSPARPRCGMLVLAPIPAADTSLVVRVEGVDGLSISKHHPLAVQLRNVVDGAPREPCLYELNASVSVG